MFKVRTTTEEGIVSEYECEEYALTPLAKGHYMLVTDPNSADPKKSVRLDVRAGERGGAEPLRFDSIEIVNEDGEVTDYRSVRDETDNGKPRAVELETRSPTYEEYVRSGYRPSSYPPHGHDVVPSSGYDDYLANKASVDSEWDAKHLADDAQQSKGNTNEA